MIDSEVNDVVDYVKRNFNRRQIDELQEELSLIILLKYDEIEN